MTTDKTDENTYDYIVVGGGSAGCVLANRLSADPNKRVCLLEAGPDDKNPLIHIPAAVAVLREQKNINWHFNLAPQKHLGDKTMLAPRGRVLGGTSAINGMVYYRGHRKDFDGWAEAGNTGWSYRDVLPYFIRSENNATFSGSAFHGNEGPMRVSSLKPNPLVEDFVQSALSLQYQRCPDFNGASPEGFGPRQVTIRDGRRETMATAFLKPVRGRKNLDVRTNANVHRVLLENKRAIGVAYETDGALHCVFARAEIVLSAGAFGSPLILMHSGIGDAEKLQEQGIVSTHHLPEVGQNLQDHVGVAIKMRTKSRKSYGISLPTLPRGAWNVLEYALFRRGPFASNALEAHGIVKSHPGLEMPDLQIVFIPAHRNESGFAIPMGHGYGINIVMLAPESKGELSLSGPNISDKPIIDPNFFSEEKDIEPIVAGFDIARRILQAPPFTRYNAWEVAPGPDVQQPEQIRDYIKKGAGTIFHPTSTCRMGADANSVVDPELKVRGIEGLRIADASVFPKITTGNTNAPVVMVAEKAADLMLGRPPPPPVDPPELNQT